MTVSEIIKQRGHWTLDTLENQIADSPILCVNGVSSDRCVLKGFQ